MKVAALNTYPIKSCRGRAVQQAKIGARGFISDRRAMIVDQDGVFLSQRSHPKLAQIDVDASDGLRLSWNGHDVTATFGSDRKQVQVWRDTLSARLAQPEANDRLSAFLGEPVYLVLMDDQSDRPTDPDFGAPSQVSFADGYPYLITTTASLKALSEVAGTAIPMDRFRPNIVIDTDTPWIEDTWTALEIGEQRFDVVKPCTRCVVTTLDQQTGAQVGQSTMQALIKTRARSGDWGKGVVFGMNAIARDLGGDLRVGMKVRAA